MWPVFQTSIRRSVDTRCKNEKNEGFCICHRMACIQLSMLSVCIICKLLFWLHYDLVTLFLLPEGSITMYVYYTCYSFTVVTESVQQVLCTVGYYDAQFMRDRDNCSDEGFERWNLAKYELWPFPRDLKISAYLSVCEPDKRLTHIRRNITNRIKRYGLGSYELKSCA
jgi:hypothetical protein